MDEEFIEEIMFTAKELEDLESVIEEDLESSISNDIDDVRVNTDPRSREIKEIIDLRYINLDR